MRKLITRSVIATLALLVMASSARADLIPIGQLQWLDSDPQLGGQFSVINQTGAAASADSTDEFPVIDLLTFLTLNLDVTQADASIVSLALGDFTANLNSLDSDFFLRPLFGSLTGTVNTGIVTLDSDTNAAWNGQWNIVTGILVAGSGLAPITVDPTLSFLETSLIYVEANPVVPEPLTLTLFATGLAGVLARRRLAARR